MAISIVYLTIIIISIAVGYLIFNWYMQPTKELLKEQNRLLRKLANENEPEATKDFFLPNL